MTTQSGNLIIICIKVFFWTNLETHWYHCLGKAEAVIAWTDVYVHDNLARKTETKKVRRNKVPENNRLVRMCGVYRNAIRNCFYVTQFLFYDSLMNVAIPVVYALVS